MKNKSKKQIPLHGNGKMAKLVNPSRLKGIDPKPSKTQCNLYKRYLKCVLTVQYILKSLTYTLKKYKLLSLVKQEWEKALFF